MLQCTIKLQKSLRNYARSYYVTVATVELVDVEDGIVKLQLLGACGTCPSSTITLKAGIERALVEEVPGVVEVEQVF